MLADRFRIVNHLLKHEFNVAGKPQFEARKERGVGDLGKAAESSEFFTELQEENEQGIRRDREDFLQNESRKEASKRKIPFSSKVVIKGIEKSLGNEERNIQMLFERLKKGRDIIHEHITAV